MVSPNGIFMALPITSNAFNHMPHDLIYQTTCQSWSIEFAIIFYTDISIPYMGQTQYPSKSWVLKCLFPFKVRQHSQQQLNLQYKVGWILYKMVSAPSFYITLPVHTNPISKKSLCLLQPIFTSLYDHKVTPTIPTNTPFPYTSAIVHLPVFTYSHLYNSN